MAVEIIVKAGGAIAVVPRFLPISRYHRACVNTVEVLDVPVNAKIIALLGSSTYLVL